MSTRISIRISNPCPFQTVNQVNLNPLATSNSLDLKPNRSKFLSIDKESTIKDERRLVHACVHLLPVDFAELFPLGGDYDSLSILACLKRGGADGHLLLNWIDSVQHLLANLPFFLVGDGLRTGFERGLRASFR